MDTVQQILVYIIVALAVCFLLNKFLIPKQYKINFSKSKKKSACGDNDCGCH